MAPTDIVDSRHEPRDCPYCGHPQFWSMFSTAYCHAHNLNLHCDEERLALWDLGESMRKDQPDGLM